MLSLVFLASQGHAIEFKDCPPEDGSCFDANHVAACNSRDVEVEDCRAWIRRLEDLASLGSREAYLHIGLANEVLADASRDPQESESYRQRAVETYRQMIARDPTDAQAHAALARAVEDHSERIDLLRRAVVLDPEDLMTPQFLANALTRDGRGGPAEHLEAGQLLEQAYDHQTGSNRWFLASGAQYHYHEAGEDERAVAFRQRVTRELGVGPLTKLPPDAAAEDVQRVLNILCDRNAVQAVGTRNCLDSIDAVLDALAAGVRDDRTRGLADVSADAMAELVKGEPRLWDALQDRLGHLLEQGFKSHKVRQAYEMMSDWNGVIVVH